MNFNSIKDFTEMNMIELILKAEGGYVNHPSDPGGETNFGITKRTAELYRVIRTKTNGVIQRIDLWKKHNWDGNMRTLPKGLAVDIYDHIYWDAVSGDYLHDIHPFIAYHLFDFGVNAGPSRAAKHLQLVLNELTGSKLIVDGKIGNGTLSVLENYVNASKGNAEKLINRLMELQRAHYDRIIRINPKLAVFRKGWYNRIEEKRRLFNKIGYQK